MFPLKGVVVLDISRLLPGGYASLLLREMGARVIKIEQPGVGDYYRALFKGRDLLGGRQVFVINEGKESLGLDLKSREGREIFLKLVRKADVVVESFRPGVLKKLRLDYSRLKKINPRIILCSITGAGQKGPDSHLAGHDLNYLGLSGLLSKIQDQDGRVVVPDFQVVDLASGLETHSRIAAALYQRQKTKKGCWIDTSLLEAGRSMAKLYPPRSSGRTFLGGGVTRYGVYETADCGHVTLAALEGKFWNQLCKIVGRPEWTEGEGSLQIRNSGSRQELEQIFKSRKTSEWTEIGRQNDICLFPVEDVREPAQDPEKKAPALGQHTGKILKSLGMSRKEIESLKNKGVIT